MRESSNTLHHLIGVSLFIRSARSRHTSDMSCCAGHAFASKVVLQAYPTVAPSFHTLAVDQCIYLRCDLLDIVASNLDVVVHGLGTFLHVLFHND
jgi:hypothetical protein